jgi:hypothetical protein
VSYGDKPVAGLRSRPASPIRSNFLLNLHDFFMPAALPFQEKAHVAKARAMHGICVLLPKWRLTLRDGMGPVLYLDHLARKPW